LPDSLLANLVRCCIIVAQAAKTNGIESALAELDMDHYDSTDEERDDDDMDGEASAAVVARALGGRSAGIVLDDPYLATGADSDDEDGLGDLDSEEKDDYVLRADDLLILAARTEDDVSTLEVWVYEEASSSTGRSGDCGVGW
jgi:periodic tryptophan protein 1